MKKIFAIITILILINQPLYALGPALENWGIGREDDVAAIARALCEEMPEQDRESRGRLEAQFRAINRAIPIWETLKRNEDGSVEIVIRYVTKYREESLAVVRAVKAEDTGYKLEKIGDRALANNRAVRGMLGLNFSRVGVPAGVLEEEKKVGLPQALAYVEEKLLKESPGAFAYRNAVTEEEPVKEVLGVIEEVKKRMGTPIKAVIVLGIGGQSLGNRAVVQMLGSQEVKFIFPDNITNPNRWLAELEGINPNEVLLYVSSKTGGTDETMANFWFFWEWLIQKIGTQETASGLLAKLQGVNLANVKLNELVVPEEERALLQTTLNRIVVSTTPEKNGPIYTFAVNNQIPIVPLQAPIEGRYTVSFRSGQLTAALAGNDIEKMRQAVVPFANAFEENNPELNPALEAAMYANALGRPILAAVSSNRRLTPLFEWTRQLVNESLGKEGKGPYLTFAAGKEAGQDLMSAPKNKLFLVINVGEEKIRIPGGVSAIEINIPEINEETLARVFLFLEEFTVRYGTFLGVNPVSQPWVDRFKEILTKTAEGFNTSPEARAERQSVAGEKKELAVTGGLEGPGTLSSLLTKLTENDKQLEAPVQVPESELGFNALLGLGTYSMQGELEGAAQNLAMQLYTAGRLGKSVNPFFIYSANPRARVLGEFIKYLGQKRTLRLAKQGGGILWDYLIGTTDQHSTAQYLGAGTDIAVTTFLHFLQEPELNPPIIRANGLIHKRLEGKTPKEVSTLYLEAVRQALNEEGRITNTLEVPNEEEANLVKLYQLLVRVSELYSRLVEYENSGGDTIDKVVRGNESTIVEPEKGVITGVYREEKPIEPFDLNRLAVPMSVGGVAEKSFINPKAEGLTGEVSTTLNQFTERVSMLARMVSFYARKKGSFLNNLAAAEELKEKARPEFYVFKLEDTVAKVEVEKGVSDILWEEIKIRAANTMIARTVQEIKRINPKAMVVVYTENDKLTERRVRAALDAIDSGGGRVFDKVVCGNIGKVIEAISGQEGWAMDRTVFASVDKIERKGENIRSVIVPKEGFTPFPELITVMRAVLNIDETVGLPIDRIIESYRIWLELAGFSGDEIELYLRGLNAALSSRENFIVTLPIPPVPKAGSVIEQLDDKYKETSNIKGFA